MKQFFLNKRFGLGLCLLFLAVTLVFGWDRGGNDEAIAQESPDAIAIRVIPNPDHYSPMRWYREQGFSGAPQSLLVDGYEAIRDGRTVYVNVANVTEDNKIYTNIYLISYNQDAESKTVDIFGRILAQWKFNTNIDGVGVCSGNQERNCILDSHCEAMGYCQRTTGQVEEVLKAELIRDVKRLSQLAEINIALENYKNRNQRYPALSAGTYLANHTVSVWPSWQNTLAKDLGVTLPIDPINRLGDCGGSGFNPITCWDENDKSFGGSIEGDKLVLPDNSFAFVYSSNYNGSEANVCAVMESGFISEYGEGACPGSSALTRETGVTGQVDNRPPRLLVSCPPVACGTTNYTVQIRATDPDGDLVTFGIDNVTPENWVEENWQGTPESSWIRKVENQVNVAQIVFFRVGEVGDYFFTIKADDGRDGVAEQVCNIRVYKPDEVFSVTSISDAEVYNCPLDVCSLGSVYHAIEHERSVRADTNLYVEYSLASAPDWLSIESNTGKIYIEDSDKSNVRDTRDYNIRVKAQNYCEVEVETGYKLIVKKNEWCGDDVVQDGEEEECDGANGLNGWSCLNSDLLCDNCKRKCALPGDNPYQGSCGDGDVQAPEQCEANGEGTSQNDQYECVNCQWSGGWCGDGVVQNNLEQCDGVSGVANNDLAGCTPDCRCAAGYTWDGSMCFKACPGDSLQFSQMWHWNGSDSPNPSYNQVMMTPVVADIDRDGNSEVVFTTFSGNGYANAGYLRIIDGKIGTHKRTMNTMVSGAGGVAVGNIDDDEFLEIITILPDTRIVAFKHDGTVKWTSSGNNNNDKVNYKYATPVIADLNNDGSPEIIVGGYVFNNKGEYQWKAVGNAQWISTAVDLTLDGKLEVVTGCAVHRSDGSELWNRCVSVGDGRVAVGDFTDDGYPEVVVVSNRVYLLNGQTGVVIWSRDIPEGGGGAPTVADFTGDGKSDIGVAGKLRYVVFNADGDVVWNKVIQDESSAITGSSVFDFNNDGSAEVLYNDETTFRVYRGSDGHVLHSRPNGSGTLIEYPIVVDVNHDGQANVLIPANNYVNGTFAGVRAFGNGDTTCQWAGTRQIWNQHAYHITNVNDDGSIPQYQKNNWAWPSEAPFNNFRQNKFEQKVFGGN